MNKKQAYKQLLDFAKQAAENSYSQGIGRETMSVDNG